MKRICTTALSIAFIFATVFLITTNSPWWASLMLLFLVGNETPSKAKPRERGPMGPPGPPGPPGATGLRGEPGQDAGGGDP